MVQHRPTPFGLRMPEELKQRVQAEAQAEDRSVNSFIVRTLREAMDAKPASEPNRQTAL